MSCHCTCISVFQLYSLTLHQRVYFKSSIIKLPGGVIYLKHLWGRLNGEGEKGLFERAAYSTLQRNIALYRLKMPIVLILDKEQERKVEKLNT